MACLLAVSCLDVILLLENIKIYNKLCGPGNGATFDLRMSKLLVLAFLAMCLLRCLSKVIDDTPKTCMEGKKHENIHGGKQLGAAQAPPLHLE